MTVSLGGGPGSLNGRRNPQPFRDFGEIGSDDRSPRFELTYGPHSMLLGHHPISRRSIRGNAGGRESSRSSAEEKSIVNGDHTSQELDTSALEGNGKLAHPGPVRKCLRIITLVHRSRKASRISGFARPG